MEKHQAWNELLTTYDSMYSSTHWSIFCDREEQKDGVQCLNVFHDKFGALSYKDVRIDFEGIQKDEQQVKEVVSLINSLSNEADDGCDEALRNSAYKCMELIIELFGNGDRFRFNEEGRRIHYKAVGEETKRDKRFGDYK